MQRLFDLISPWFRTRRMLWFRTVFDLRPELRILDVGGYPQFWRDSRVRSKITILNVHPIAEEADCVTVLGDGRELQFGDLSFDVVFSNSVIEHLGNYESQERFAAECLRVGRAVWIQTPARWFPVEPHLLTPFIHYLPRSWQRRVLRYGTVWGWLVRPSPEQVAEFLAEVRLLTKPEMRRLFPGCEIWPEKVLGLTKSYVAIRKSFCNVKGSRPDATKATLDLE